MGACSLYDFSSLTLILVFSNEQAPLPRFGVRRPTTRITLRQILLPSFPAASKSLQTSPSSIMPLRTANLSRRMLLTCPPSGRKSLVLPLKEKLP
jgi:hypothetical protein